MPTIEDIRAQLDKPQSRSFVIERDAVVDEDLRTVELAFASANPVGHWMGDLILTMDAKKIRTDRLDRGAALLMDHDWKDVVGVIESYKFDKKEGIARAVVRFSDSARGEEVFRDVKNGIRRNISVGFMMYDLEFVSQKEGESPLYRCDDWEPFEISIVSVPADISVGVGRAMEPIKFKVELDTEDAQRQLEELSEATHTRAISNKEENTMTPEEIAAQKAADEQRALELAGARRNDVLAFADIYGERAMAEDLLLASPDATQEDIRTAIKAKRDAAPSAPQPPSESPEAIAKRNGVQLAVTVPRHGAIRSFSGERATEKAYRFGKWILGGPLGRRSAMDWCASNGINLTRDQSEGVNEAGGFLVPEEFGNDMIDLKELYGVFRRNTKIVPMSSDVQSDPRRTGGLTAVFEGEADTGAVSTLGWDRVSLTAKKLMVLARYSSEISEDSLISMADTLANEMAYAFANKEDECGFNGDGTSTYGGIVGVREKILGLSATRANIAGLVVGSGNLYSELALVDFEAVVAKLPEYADTPAAKWFVSRSFYYNVMVKLALAAGGNAAVDIEAQRGKRFLGYDVEFAQVMPKVEANDQVCALLGDLAKGSRMGTRRDTTISLSEHVLHSTDQIQVRGTERFDINVHDVGNESGTAASRVAGPIVGLLTAAS